jgi:hypothetical protein
MIGVIHNPNFLERLHDNVVTEDILHDYQCSKLVALVPGDDLADGNRLTRSVDTPWVRNFGVANLVMEARSTSVGDFLKRGEIVYMVAAVGYIELGKIGE